MQRICFVTIVAAVTLAMGMGVMGGTAIADDNTSDDLEGVNASEVEQTVDSETVITDWEFDDDQRQFTVQFYAEDETALTVAESGSFEEGSGDFAYYTREIPAGESVETFQVTEADGAALTMATPLSQEEERGAVISTGAAESDAESEPFQHFGGESGLFSGVAMTVGLAGLGTVIVLRQEESGVIEA
ncbi:hypothetical protein SAMN04487967_1707 [Natronorubrum sediminis]|uniref:Uncharacterized protein n=1 Tax=Natronorubrum sediminis TaxID=640943 RepID=A0A1H6FV53_9EURY|nr:hypothetical protein SAMN04487967_1707 [Natronorubrum sediminis]